jgi:hypothetical protein
LLSVDDDDRAGLIALDQHLADRLLELRDGVVDRLALLGGDGRAERGEQLVVHGERFDVALELAQRERRVLQCHARGQQLA